MSRSSEARIPPSSICADPSLDRRAAAALHDLNNPLSFLIANHMIEQEHCEMLQGLLAALGALDDARVNALLQQYEMSDRLTELAEILTDNEAGLDRVRAVARQLRVVLTSLSEEARPQ